MNYDALAFFCFLFFYTFHYNLLMENFNFKINEFNLIGVHIQKEQFFLIYIFISLVLSVFIIQFIFVCESDKELDFARL